MDDVYKKLAEASSPDDVKRVLDECGYTLSESGEKEDDKSEAEGPEVEVEISAEPPEPKKPKAGGFKSRMFDAVGEAMGETDG